jgi:hypothetical protein
MLISLPTAADLRQVARWHDNQAKIKQRKKLPVEAKRHLRMADELRLKAKNMEQT